MPAAFFEILEKVHFERQEVRLHIWIGVQTDGRRDEMAYEHAQIALQCMMQQV